MEVLQLLQEVEQVVLLVDLLVRVVLLFSIPKPSARLKKLKLP